MTLKNLEITMNENWLKILTKEWRNRCRVEDKIVIERLLIRHERRYKELNGIEYEWMTPQEVEERRNIDIAYKDKIYGNGSL